MCNHFCFCKIQILSMVFHILPLLFFTVMSYIFTVFIRLNFDLLPFSQILYAIKLNKIIHHYILTQTISRAGT